MIQLDMSAPATLCRASASSSNPEPDRRRGVAVANGPFLIMAHGYLAQSPADRPDFWIRSARRKVTPAEIEETMRHWHKHRTANDDGSGGAPAS